MKLLLNMEVSGVRGAGKTTLVEKVVAALKSEGYQVVRRTSMREEWGTEHYGFWVENPAAAGAKPDLSLLDMPPASLAAGPVNCQKVLRAQGKRYPRTCERCGLGPCPFYDNHGNARVTE